MNAAGRPFAAFLCLALTIPASGASDKPLPIPAATESTQVRLVLIDTVVTDSHGRPVPGLGLPDFRLVVDGTKTPVEAVEDRCQEGSAPEAAPAPMASAADEVAAPDNTASSTPPSPRVVLYFDLPHLSPPAASRSVSAARRFIASSGAEGARYMIIAYGPKVRVLAPFTSDKDRLFAALDRVLGPGATYDEGALARLGNLREVAMASCPPDKLTAGGGEHGVVAPFTACPSQVSVARQYAQVEERLAKSSLAALTQTMISLGGSSDERKALVLFTETLKDEPGVEYLVMANTTPMREQISVNQEWKRLVTEANAARVSFYPVYAPGLGELSDVQIGWSTTSLPRSGDSPGVERQQNSLPGGQGSSQTPNDNNPGLTSATRAIRTGEDASLGFNASIAASTGGRHLGRTNDLNRVFSLVAEDRACLYVLAYKPGPEEPGKRHAIEVHVDRKGARVRSRESYVDWPPEEAAARRMRMAMAAPGAFNVFELGLAAFPAGHAGGKTQVLVAVSIPAGALASSAEGLAAPGTVASVRVRGRVATTDKVVCTFGEPFDVPRDLYAGSGETIHYEAACALSPGRYELVAAVEEAAGGDLSAIRREIAVPDLGALYVGEAQLWVASPRDLVYRSEASSILGPSAGLERGAAAPRAERRLASGESGSLFTLVCPGKSAEDLLPVQLTRTLLAGDKPVASFAPLDLGEIPDSASDCWGITSPLPPKILGPGVYDFDYQVRSPALAEPVSGVASFAVGEPSP